MPRVQENQLAKDLKKIKKIKTKKSLATHIKSKKKQENTPVELKELSEKLELMVSELKEKCNQVIILVSRINLYGTVDSKPVYGTEDIPF